MMQLLFKYILIFAIAFELPIQGDSKNPILDNEISLKLIFNQPQYIAGDTAFFKGYLYGFPENFIKAKRVIGLTLKNAAGDDLVYNRFVFVNGVSINQLVLPNDISPGVYWLIADIEGVTTDGEMRTTFVVSGNSNYETVLKDSTTPTLQVEIKSNQSDYRQREKVEFLVSHVADQEIIGDLSITVLKENLFNESIDSTFSALYGLYSLSTEVSASTFSGQSPDVSYFSGIAINANTKTPVPDSTQVVFYLNKNDFVYQIFTKNGGRFNFQLFKEFSDEEIFYHVFNNKGKMDSVEVVLDRTTNEHVPIDKITSVPASRYAHYVANAKTIMNSYSYFLEKEKDLTNTQNFDWWPDVDYEIRMDKYEPFYLLEEVFINIVPYVKFRRGGNEEGARIFLEKIAGYTNRNPLYILDGIMTDESEAINRIDPNHIIRIGVCRSKELLTRYGKLGVNGIIAIETDYNWQEESFPTSENSFAVTGISKSLVFNNVDMKDVSIDTKRIPRLRPSLFWNPSVTVQKNGIAKVSFFTSDDLGYYSVLVMALTKQGDFVSKQFRIRVAP